MLTGGPVALKFRLMFVIPPAEPPCALSIFQASAMIITQLFFKHIQVIAHCMVFEFQNLIELIPLVTVNQSCATACV